MTLHAFLPIIAISQHGTQNCLSFVLILLLLLQSYKIHTKSFRSEANNLRKIKHELNLHSTALTFKNCNGIKKLIISRFKEQLYVRTLSGWN